MRKVICFAAAAIGAIACAFADLTVRVTDEGKFEEKGLRLATRAKENFAFRKLGGRMAAVWDMPYVYVNYGQSQKLRPATEAAKWEYCVEVEYFDGTNTAADVKAMNSRPWEKNQPRGYYFKYDSVDESHNPKSVAPGAWKTAGLMEITGSGTWKKATFRLPWARFDRKALNDFDFRIDPGFRTGGHVWGIGSLRLFVQPREEEKIDPATLTVLENDKLRLEFDGQRVRRIYDKTRKIDILKAASIVHPVLGLQMLKKVEKEKKVGGGGESREVVTQAFRESSLFAKAEKPVLGGTKDEPTLSLAYTFDCGVVAKPRVKLTKGGELEWTIAITCPEGVEVRDVDYPMLSGFAIAGDPHDDLYYGGGVWRQMWSHSYRRGGGMKPQNSATRFMTLWDEHAAAYLGLEDPAQNDWRFFDCGDAAGGARMGIRLSMRAKAGETWNGHGTVWRFAVTDGGTWHKAAQIARAYSRKTLRGPVVPNHVKWLADDWIYENSNEYPRQGWDVINNSDAENSDPRSFGTNDCWYPLTAIHFVNRQMIDGPCAAYCGMYPYPSPVWGSLEEFQEKLALNRALGGFYTPYFNFNLFSPGYLRHKRIGAYAKSLLPPEERARIPSEDWFRKVGQANYDGPVDESMLDSWFGEWDQCVVTPEWREWTRNWMNRYIDWGGDGMYYDQLNMVYGTCRLCPGYEDSYGSWLKASRDTVGLVTRETRAKNPYALYSGEVANEIIAQTLDISMTSGVFDHHEVFRYVNPWAIVFDGRANGGNQENKYRFNWQSGARFDQGMAKHRDYLALRRRVKSFLYDAEFRDGEDLMMLQNGVAKPERYTIVEGSDLLYPLNSGLTAKWFLFDQSKVKVKGEGEDGGRGAVVNVLSVEEILGTNRWGKSTVIGSKPIKNAAVRVPTAEIGEVKAAWAFTLEGTCSRLSPRVSRPGFVELSLPECEASSIILSNGRLHPLVAWEHDPIQTRGGKGTVKLKVTNVNDQPMNVSVKLRLPEGWQMGDATACRVNEDGSIHLQRGEDTASPMTRQAAASPFALRPGETRDIDVAYVVADDAPLGRHDLWADVTGSSTSTFSAYCYAVVNEPLLMDLRGVSGEYHVWFRNLGSEPIKGSLAMSAKDGVSCFVGGQETGDAKQASRTTTLDVTIPARSVLRVPVTVEDAELLEEGSEIAATFKTGIWPLAKRIVRHKAVFPILPNRHFEIDHAGDMKPDWWMCRHNMDWTYECMNLTTNAHSGKYALELKPWKRYGAGVWANPTFFDARLGATYRISFWSKAPQGGTVMFAGEFIHLPKSEDWVKTEKTITVREIRWNYFQIQLGKGPILIDDFEFERVKDPKKK